MPDIPSLGIDLIDIVDPGMVNIEEQAYPRPLDLAQALARNLGALISGGAFVANPPPPGFQAGNRPTEVFVAGQPFVQPSLSLGTALPTIPEFDIADQAVLQPVAEFIVTESGSFEFNRRVPTSVSQTITAVQTILAPGPTGANITFYLITFGVAVNLMDYGVDLVNTEALFPNSAPPLAPEDVPAGIITKFTNRQIMVDGTDLTADAPQVGDIVRLDITRHGADVVFDLFAPDANVFIDSVQSASAAQTVVADSRSVITAFASDGVLTPFIGAGTRIPLLLYLDLRETAFFPADRPITTRGLPVNVNIG